MAEKTKYRFECRIIDAATGEVVIEASSHLGRIDQFGGCESVDHETARMLRAFERTARDEHEAATCEDAPEPVTNAYIADDGQFGVGA